MTSRLLIYMEGYARAMQRLSRSHDKVAQVTQVSDTACTALHRGSVTALIKGD